MTANLLHVIKTGKIIYHELCWIILADTSYECSICPKLSTVSFKVDGDFCISTFPRSVPTPSLLFQKVLIKISKIVILK